MVHTVRTKLDTVRWHLADIVSREMFALAFAFGGHLIGRPANAGRNEKYRSPHVVFFEYRKRVNVIVLPAVVECQADRFLGNAAKLDIVADDLISRVKEIAFPLEIRDLLFKSSGCRVRSANFDIVGRQVDLVIGEDRNFH